MHLIVCLDDHNGMMFNGRRQSQDKVLRKQMLLLSKDAQLWMNGYSAKQFEEIPDFVTVDEAFLKNAPDNAYCFVENEDVLPFVQKISSVIIYRWNRSYPAERIFPADAVLRGKTMLSSRTFVGSSHEKITEETYG